MCHPLWSSFKICEVLAVLFQFYRVKAPVDAFFSKMDSMQSRIPVHTHWFQSLACQLHKCSCAQNFTSHLRGHGSWGAEGCFQYGLLSLVEETLTWSPHLLLLSPSFYFDFTTIHISSLSTRGASSRKSLTGMHFLLVLSSHPSWSVQATVTKCRNWVPYTRNTPQVSGVWKSKVQAVAYSVSGKDLLCRGYFLSESSL